MPVPCDHVDVWLGRFVDGELRGRARRDAEAHVADCGACQARIDEFRDLGNALRDALREELGAPLSNRDLEFELEERIRDGVVHPNAYRAKLTPAPWQLSAAAALLAFVVGTGFFLLRSGATTPGTAPIAFQASNGAGTPSAALASSGGPVVVRVLPSGRASMAARVMETGDADFGMVWIGDHEAPP